MRCYRPLDISPLAVPCGQCGACLINRKRVWVTRMMMERMAHKDAAFVTLTYSDAYLPFTGERCSPMPTLVKSDVQLFLKRLRKRLEPAKIRFFAVGEYGELTLRPHYHLAIFGLPGSPSAMLPSHLRPTLSSAEAMVHAAWGKGHTLTGILAKESMEYLCGYVSKKMTRKDDVRLLGRQPEFSLKSLRPPLGSDVLHEIASTLLGSSTPYADVPSVIRVNGKEWPLGQSMKRRLRLLVGRSANSPREALQKLVDDLIPVRQFAYDSKQSLAEVLRQLSEGDADALVGRENLRKQRRKL